MFKTMAQGKIILTHDSIKNELKSYKDKPAKAIIEYVWNGFDAGANTININYSFPESVEGASFGYPTLEISDDGEGWNFDEKKKMENFLVSEKNSENTRSLPHGKKGVGRCTFHVFANRATWETVYLGRKYSFELTADALDTYKTLAKELSISKGAKVTFEISSNLITQGFFEHDLVNEIKLEFAWFLILFPKKKILINGEEIEISDLIAKRIKQPDVEIENQKFNIDIVQWKVKLTGESSKYYFLNSEGEEKRKRTTGLNKQSDLFYHSVFVSSDFFNSYYPADDDEENGGQEQLLEKEERKIYRDLLQKIKEKLIEMRREYLVGYSDEMIEKWKNEEVFPTQSELAIDEGEYTEIIKEVYVVAPQLFTNTGDDQRKVILRLLGSLLSTEESEYILKILEQVYGLSKEDKDCLMELLQRTTLSNIIKTVREVDHRINVIASLEEILFDHEREKTTKEVVHLQSVLDSNFWIFGEEYRLFQSAEGSIKKTLDRFKDEILHKEDEEIQTESRKEMDLFLTKQEISGSKTTCIIVEIKRPSVKLKKKEYDQIDQYMETVLGESSCNGNNIEWRFYLIGNDYDEHIEGKITSASSWGEQDKGLTHRVKDGRVKLYVRKWSDILNVEQKSKYKYLKDKLQAESKELEKKTTDEIVEDTKPKNQVE